MRTPTTVNLYLQNPLPVLFPTPKLVSSNSKPNFLNFRSKKRKPRGFRPIYSQACRNWTSTQEVKMILSSWAVLQCSLIKLVFFSTNSDDSSSSNESLAASNGDRGRPVLEGKLHFAKFETQKINDCIDFIRSKQLRLTGSEQHGASGSAKCVIKATGGAAFKYANLFKEKLGISLDKADEMDCLVAGANFLLKLGGGYHFGLPVGFVADSIGATLGAGAAFLLGRTAAANDQIQVIEMIKLLETKGSKTF